MRARTTNAISNGKSVTSMCAAYRGAALREKIAVTADITGAFAGSMLELLSEFYCCQQLDIRI